MPGAADAQQRIVAQLVAFIPAEPMTLFIAALAAVGPDSRSWVRWTLLAAIAVLTPVWVEIHYLQKVTSRKARRKLPLFEMTAGLAAFASWSTTLPGSPWTDIGGFSARWGLMVALLTAGGLITASELRDALAKGKPHPAQPAVS